MPDFPDDMGGEMSGMGDEGMDQGAPMPDMGGGEEPQMGGDEPWGDEEPFDAGVEADEETDPKNFIQQLSGKLAQSLRDFHSQNETDLDLEKFALNSVISATHTGQMDPDEQGDIIEKIKTAGTDEYETKDEKEGEDSDEPSLEEPATTGSMPTNPAGDVPPAPAGGMGENYKRKEVFADPKLGVPDEESNFYPLGEDKQHTVRNGFYDSKGNYHGSDIPISNPFPEDDAHKGRLMCKNSMKTENHEDDFERLGRSVEYGIDPEVGEEDFDFDIEEGDNNVIQDLDINNKKDIFVDDSIERMIRDYLNTQGGFQQEDMTEPVTTPETKPTTEPNPTIRPSRRAAPYRIHEQPGVKPNPKAKR